MKQRNFSPCLVFIGATLLLVGFGGAARAESEARTITVAAAADLQFALGDFIAQFEKDHPDVKIKAIYGASGSLFAQIDNGAPFDLFLAADAKYPQQLIESKKADGGSLFLYAVGHLVLWAPKDAKVDVKQGFGALLDARVRKIAIANPATAPYGRAALAALQKAGVYEQIKDKIVLGENIMQTAQFVQSGAADAGVIALSLALAPPMKTQGTFWNVPLDWYPRLEQGGVILKNAPNAADAKLFCAELTGKRGRKILQRYGFSLPQSKK